MANKVTIDVEARFVDNVTEQANSASSAFDRLEKEARSAAKEVDSISKKKAEPKLDADNSSLMSKLDKSESRLRKIGRSKTEARLSLLDRATAVIDKVINKAKAFGNKTYSALVKIRDSNVLSQLSKMSGSIKSLTGKAWSVAVKVKDLATAPLRGIKNMLFSIKSLVLAITAGLAAKQLIMNPINKADAYSSAKISFSTLLGESQGQQMMNQLDAFAKATPFNTTNVISNAQKMLAMGWDAENIIEDMEIIGNAAAATGKLDVGLESIVRALSQIKTKGRLSTEELNQLAEAGIAAKAMLAENLGYGTGDEGIAEMTKDLEKGAIASNVAIEALLAGMKKYDGMMNSMANETVEGLWSQMTDAFDINIVRKWGQGLQDGARRGFGSIVALLDEAETAMAEFGDTLYEIGKVVSNWAADKLENAIKRIRDITGSFEFKNANLKEKISMLWNGVIVDPLKEWWENGGQKKTAETAGKIGSWIGKMLTKGLLALFGATDILDESVGTEAGSSVASSFLQGFLDNFDGSAITNALVDAIGNVWGALPTWAKILIGGYGIGKAAGGIANFAGGILNFAGGVKNAVGGFNIASSAFPILTSSGSGILGAIGKAGVGLGATTTGGALLAGSAGIAGGLAAGASAIKGGFDLYGSYRAYKAGDELEGKAKAASGGTALGGVAAGAAIGAGIGSIVPVIGTGIGALVGAGIGGIAGWIGGNAWADEIRKTDDAVNDVTAATEKLETEEEKAAKKAKMIYQNMQDHFGDIKLSASEIARIADQIVWGDDIAYFEQFTTATKAAEASLNSLKSAAQATNRWMWKAGLGVKFNNEEAEAITASFDEYLAAAQSYLDNKHYEFTAAVGLLVDVNSEEGMGILKSGNDFYGKLKAEIDAAGKELGNALVAALADGIITADEQAAITAAQQKIASIMEKIADAEYKAEIELIKVKFSGAKLDADSFADLVSQLGKTLDDRIAAADKAFTTSVANLKLQLAEGAIDQAEYDRQVAALIEGRAAKIEEAKLEVVNAEVEIIADAYKMEGVTPEKIKKALENTIKDGIDPIDWTPDQAREYLGLDNLSESSALALGTMLSHVFGQMSKGDLLPESVDANVDVNVTGNAKVTPVTDPVQLLIDFGIPPEHAALVHLLLSADKETLGKIDVSNLAKEFGIPESQAWTIIQKLSAEKTIAGRLAVLASDFGIPDSISHTIRVNFTAIAGAVTNAIGSIGNFFSGGGGSGGGNGLNIPSLKGSGYRGGIFGGESAMDAFARGGRTDIGGIVGGSTRFIRVNEEAPEMVIPLSSQRRDRALDLWMKTGELLDVPGFARGGSTDGDQDEGIRFNTYGGSDSAGGRTVQINMGGIKLEINVSGSDKESIVEAIKAQAGDLADYIVGVIADSLETEFENTPVRGGAS